MRLEVGKTYIDNEGYKVKVVAYEPEILLDLPYIAVVLLPSLFRWYAEDGISTYKGARLREMNEWEDFKKDDPVMIRSPGSDWSKRYFSHVRGGFPYVFMEGKTSWTARDTILVLECRHPTEEELNS